MKIYDCFIDIIHQVMTDQNLQQVSQQPSFEIRADSTLEEVLHYADWYVAGRAYLTPTFRYDNYRRIFDAVDVDTDARIIHIDIGCGTGPFAWALLDWADDRRIDFRNVHLYGYDWSEQAIRAAQMIRLKLMENTCPGFPCLNYTADLGTFKRSLSGIPSAPTNVYVITFGYVLAGNHDPEDLAVYLDIIRTVESIKDPSSKIWILASDAVSYRGNFATGWESLRISLSSHYASVPIPGYIPGYSSECCVVG